MGVRVAGMICGGESPFPYPLVSVGDGEAVKDGGRGGEQGIGTEGSSKLVVAGSGGEGGRGCWNTSSTARP